MNLTDGDGGSSNQAIKLVQVTPVNDLPIISLPTTTISYTENGPSLIVFNGATAVDADLAAATATTATLTVTNTNGESTDRLQIVPSGVFR